MVGALCFRPRPRGACCRVRVCSGLRAAGPADAARGAASFARHKHTQQILNAQRAGRHFCALHTHTAAE